MTKLPRAGRGVPVKEWGELCHTHWLSVGFLGPAVALSTSGLSPEQALTQLSARLCLKDPVTVPVLLASCLLCGSNLGLFFFWGGGGTSLWSTLGLLSCELSVKLSDSQNLRLFSRK